GYAYAHFLVSIFRERPKFQIGIHLTLLVLSFLFLPITPSEELKPTGGENPIPGIVLLVTMTVGLPFLVISASGPLLQAWFNVASGGKSPYRLYAVSNFGSLLGLVSYPFLFEPWIGVKTQTFFWSGGHVVYGALAALCGWLFWKNRNAAAEKEESEKEYGEAPSQRAAIPEPPTRSARFFWIAFAACGSVALLAVTSQMSQDVAVVPFLWVLPLALYLTTFIIAFDASRWYKRIFWIPFAMLSVAGVVLLLWLEYEYSPGDYWYGKAFNKIAALFGSNYELGDEMHLVTQITIYALGVFSCCMVCHGEMVRLKPHPRYLTGFYLAIAFGGALGGFFVSLLAPNIFDGYFELHIILLVIAGLVSWVMFRDLQKDPPKNKPALKLTSWAVIWGASVAVMALFLYQHVQDQKKSTIAMKRNFYGVLKVKEFYPDSEDHIRQLYHGRISHGRQFMQGPKMDQPITYYAKGSGPDVFFEHYSVPREPLHFGVVGLGVGTLAAFAEEGDRVRIYEINEQVEDLARDYFKYLEHCKGEEKVVLGDARMTMEQELVRGEVQQFDALFVDAFSGDSIPIHLLTREAFELYFKHLKPGGVLGVHITNLHLDLSDPVRVLAEEFGYEAHLVVENEDLYENNYSEWVLVTKNEPFLQRADDARLLWTWNREEPKAIRWTDDYCNLLKVVMW
ncbi:MAG: fused MFS/spermidine synthase, partial [Verrucomicrobiales bacterium]|nr:fused MFS/spermidine synthase [Verrucomicrobiales bacterium]